MPQTKEMLVYLYFALCTVAERPRSFNAIACITWNIRSPVYFDRLFYMPKALSSSRVLEFSLSKLHRILRPLRSKTISLAKLLEQYSAQDHLTGWKRAHTQLDYTSSPTSGDESSLLSSPEPDRGCSGHRCARMTSKSF